MSCLASSWHARDLQNSNVVKKKIKESIHQNQTVRDENVSLYKKLQREDLNPVIAP